MRTKITTSKQLYTAALFTIAFCFSAIAQQDYYWVGGTGNWDDFANHWATSSGGTEFHTSAPGIDDLTYFDENSFDAEGQIVTVDDFPQLPSMDWSMATNSPTLYNEFGVLLFYGSFVGNPGMIIDSNQLRVGGVSGNSPTNFDPNGMSFPDLTIIINVVGEVHLLDSLSVQDFSITARVAGGGFFTTNDNSINTNDFSHSVPNDETTVDLSNSTIYAQSVSIFGAQIVDGQVIGSNATLIIDKPSGSTQIDKGDIGSSFFDNYIIEADHVIEAYPPIFKNLKLEAGVELAIDDAITGIEFETLEANGLHDDFITIKSKTDGSTCTLICDSPNINFNYVKLRDVTGSGAATYNAYASLDLGNVIGVNILKADQEIILELEDKSFHDVDETYVPAISTSSGLAVTFESSNNDVVVSNGSELLIVGTGTALITAKQEGDNLHNASQTVGTLRVLKANQTITLNEIPDIWIGDEFVNISATSDSNLPISYSLTGPATLNGETIEFTGTGTVQVTANQAGNENYNAAQTVIHSFEVFKKAQTITFAEISDTSEDEGFVNLDAASDAGLPITYSVVGPGEVVDGTLEFTGNGMVQVTAKQEGNDLFLAAENIRRSFEILASETEKPLFLTQPEGLGLVYPNPVADYLYFDPQLKIETIRASDLSGRVFFEGALPEDHIDVSLWDPGNYIFKIRTISGDEITTRIIRN